MIARKTIFWDVDTQYDFLRPDGRLYVPGAVEIIDNISRVRRFALANGFSIVASIDQHTTEDAEISPAPDFKTTFPPHCLVDSDGSRREGFVGEVAIDHVPLEEMETAELAGLIDRDQFHVVLHSNTVDIFDNVNTLKVLNIVEPGKVMVFGVALDVCVRHAIEGLLEWGKAQVYLITDAVKGLGIVPDEQVFEEFGRSGVEMIGIDDLKKVV